MTPEQLRTLASEHGWTGNASGNRVLSIGEAVPESVTGEFDSIIVEGNISYWPAPEVDRLWDLLASHLAEDGLAYLTFDSYPGAHQSEALREIVQTHVKISGPEAVPQALEFL